MTAFIIAALTADGFIARNSSHLANWTSKEDKQFFAKRTMEAGVVIMGLNTFKTIGRPLPKRVNIVYAPPETRLEGVEVTQQAPQELLKDLERRGYRELAICGGSTVYTMFMEADVVDKLYLTIEPVLFGSGLTLFNKQLETQLQLKTFEKLSEQTVLLEYEVLKQNGFRN